MKAKKFFGQHFLRDKTAIGAIIEAAAITNDERVLEIGPGEGVLTRLLAERARKLVAVDIDREAIETTRGVVDDLENVELVLKSALEISKDDIDTWFGGDYILVGNLPYNITSDLLRLFLVDDKIVPTRAVVMVQKEVADRMMAMPGDMSMLGLMCQLYATLTPIRKVPAGAFFPPPKVDSAVVAWRRFTPEERRDRGYEQPEKILSVAKVAFNQRRKQLVSTISSLPGFDRETLKEHLETLGLPPTARPQELAVEDWVSLIVKS